MLPKGYLQVLGFTAADVKTRNAGLAGDEETNGLDVLLMNNCCKGLTKSHK